MNNISIFNIFIIIILFYYLCFNCDDSNKIIFNEKFTLQSSIKPIDTIPICNYCGNKINNHTNKCPYYYHNSSDIYTYKTENGNVVNTVGGNGGSEFLFICNGNDYINNLTINSGSRIDSITPKCIYGNINKNGAKTNKIGGNGGVEKNIILNDGFDRLEVNSGAEIDKIKIGNNSYGGNGGGLNILSCSKGGKIKGFYGKAGDRVDKLGIICTKPKHIKISYK